MRHPTLVLILVSALGLIACTRRAPTNAPAQVQSNNATASSVVPSKYQALYIELDATLDAFDRSFDNSGTQYPVIFATELLPANGNRGTELLNSQTLFATRIFLDAVQKIGVQGVTVAIKYPMLTPDFPHSAQYLEFFKNVSTEVHKRNMKLDVEVGVIFPPPFGSLDVNYDGLTFDQYKVKNRQMVETIIEQIKPDYLNLGSEPDTEAAITGIRELNTPQGYTDLINYTLRDLDRGSTLVGAGSGTWASPEFVRSEAANTSLDFISLHVYPVTGKGLSRVITLADLAHQSSKRVILDEAWLYKTSANEPATSIAANSDIFRRDVFSFWQPLDQKFLAEIAKLAHAKNIEYVSPFWAMEFFGYLDYDPNLETLSYKALTAQATSQIGKNISTGRLSTTGEFYKGLIEGAR